MEQLRRGEAGGDEDTSKIFLHDISVVDFQIR